MPGLLEDEEKTRLTPLMYYLAFVSQISEFSIGFEIGSTSTAILLLQDIGYMRLTLFWKQLITAGSYPGAITVVLFAAWFSNRFGRKKCVLLSSFCFILGAMTTSLAYSREVLLVGRILTGFGIGSATSSVYVGECAPRHHRGSLVGIGQVLFSMGTLVATIISVPFSNDTQNGWRYIWGMQGVFSLVQFLCLLCLPESPRWFIKTSRRDEARDSLIRLRNDKDVKEELREIETNFEEAQLSFEKSGGGNVYLRMLKSPTVRRALVVGLGIQLFSTLAGITAITYYAGIIIEMSGVGDVTTAVLNTALSSSVTIVFSITGLWLINRFGRRPLAIMGMFGIFIGCLWLAITFYMIAKYSPMVTDDTLNNTCSVYRNCDDCVRNATCGFCYEDTSDVMNSACLPVSDTFLKLTSEVGACNSSSTLSKYSRKWRPNYCPVSFSWVTIIGLAICLVSDAQTVGPLIRIISVEVYPLWARSTGFSIGYLVADTCTLFVIVTFLFFVEAIHDYGVFFVLASIALIGSIFCMCFLPETKNKSLEEIEVLFLSNKRGI